MTLNNQKSKNSDYLRLINFSIIFKIPWFFKFYQKHINQDFSFFTKVSSKFIQNLIILIFVVKFLHPITILYHLYLLKKHYFNFINLHIYFINLKDQFLDSKSLFLIFKLFHFIKNFSK